MEKDVPVDGDHDDSCSVVYRGSYGKGFFTNSTDTLAHQLHMVVFLGCMLRGIAVQGVPHHQDAGGQDTCLGDTYTSGGYVFPVSQTGIPFIVVAALCPWDLLRLPVSQKKGYRPLYGNTLGLQHLSLIHI